MRLLFVVSSALVLFLQPPPSLAAESTLADGAKVVAARLKGGSCIVTAESRNGTVTYAIAGKGPETVPAEQVVFEIGSITKVFTGLLLAQAVVDGKVTLKTTLGDLLGARMRFKDSRMEAVTLLQLATHTSGLPRLPDDLGKGGDPTDPYAHYTEERLLKAVSTTPVSAKPKSEYSNFGVGLLGYLVAGVYGMTWDRAVEEKICKPLGMSTTGLIPSTPAAFATPHANGVPVKPWALSSLAGAGGLRSTAGDMMKLCGALLAPETSPLAPALALALKPYAEFPGISGQVGLCILMSKMDGQPSLEHDGGTGGSRSYMQIIPTQHVARLVLMSASDVDAASVVAEVQKLKARAEPAKEIPITPQMLEGVPGIYEVTPQVKFTIVLNTDGSPMVRLTGQPFFPVFAKAADRFFYKVTPAELQIHREPDTAASGKVSSLTLHQNGRELRAKRVADAPAGITFSAPEKLKEWTGVYALAIGDLTVELHGSTLYGKLAGQAAAPIFQVRDDRFEYDVVDAALVFERDAEGRITGVVLQQNGESLPGNRKPAPNR